MGGYSASLSWASGKPGKIEMGWCKGGEILRKTLRVVLPDASPEKRQDIVDQLVDIFEDGDCDTIDELEDDFPEIARIMEKRREEE